MQDITPGSKVTVKIVKAPASEGARKTLERVLMKSDDMKVEDARLKRARKNNIKNDMRGGRIYPRRVPKQHPIKGVVGEQQTVVATLDVIRDLKSVERFIEVSAA